METTMVVYIITWIIVIIPLILFNIKRMKKVMPDGKKKGAWGFIIFLGILLISLTLFLFVSYRTTLISRYELAAERYLTKHGELLTGQLSYAEFKEEANLLFTAEEDTVFKENLFAPGKDLKAVRFQIGDWITPRNFQNEPAFPEVDIIAEESNPVFIFCSLDNGQESSFFLLGMQADENGQNWKVIHYDLLPEAIANNTGFNSYRPNARNGKWFYISS